MPRYLRHYISLEFLSWKLGWLSIYMIMIILVLSGCDFDADQVLLEKRQKDEECRSCKTVPDPKNFFRSMSLNVKTTIANDLNRRF